MRRRLVGIVVFCTLGAALSGLPPTTAVASAPDPQHLLARVNSERTARDLAALTAATDLAEVARRHSERMAEAQDLFHNERLSAEVEGWTALGENVGAGGDADSIQDLFMSSEAHRANILRAVFGEIGIGVAERDGTVFVTEVFAARTDSSSSGAAAPRAASDRASPSRAAHHRAAAQVSVARRALAGIARPAATVPPARQRTVPARRDPAGIVQRPAPAPRNVAVLVSLVELAGADAATDTRHTRGGTA